MQPHEPSLLPPRAWRRRLRTIGLAFLFFFLSFLPLGLGLRSGDLSFFLFLPCEGLRSADLSFVLGEGELSLSLSDCSSTTGADLVFLWLNGHSWPRRQRPSAWNLQGFAFFDLGVLSRPPDFSRLRPPPRLSRLPLLDEDPSRLPRLLDLSWEYGHESPRSHLPLRNLKHCPFFFSRERPRPPPFPPPPQRFLSRPRFCRESLVASEEDRRLSRFSRLPFSSFPAPVKLMEVGCTPPSERARL